MRPGSRMLGIRPAEANSASTVPHRYRKIATREYAMRTIFWMSETRCDVCSIPSKETAPSTTSIFRMNRKNAISKVDNPNRPQKSQRALASWNVSTTSAVTTGSRLPLFLSVIAPPQQAALP